MKILLKVVGLGLAVLALPAWAHSPNQSNVRVAHCWQEGGEVVCRSTRALAGGWAHAPVQVLTEAGVLLHHTQTDGQGLVRFTRPRDGFYVLFGDRPGETVEVDGRDVRAARSAD